MEPQQPKQKMVAMVAETLRPGAALQRWLDSRTLQQLGGHKLLRITDPDPQIPNQYQRVEVVPACDECEGGGCATCNGSGVKTAS